MKSTVKNNKVKTATVASASVGAGAKASAPATITIAIPANVRASILSTVIADSAAFKAATVRDDSILTLGKLIRSTMAKAKGATRENVRASLAATFTEAYSKATPPKSEKYASQQLTRVMQTAFATDEAIKTSETIITAKREGKAVTIDGKERKANVNDILKVMTGGLSLKGSKFITTKKSNRGGKNQKTPLESFNFNEVNNVTAGKVAKLKLIQMAIGVVTAFTENKYELDDVRDAFEKALQD